MRTEDFLYSIVNENGIPLTGYPDAGFILEADLNTLKDANGRPMFLEYSPEGWQDVLVKFGRNQKYRGLFRDFTVQLKFPKDGRYILHDAFWRKGIEANRGLVIHKADRTLWPIKHKTWYTGDFDFSKFKQGRVYTSINVMEGGVGKYLKAFENTKYEIPVNELNVKMDGFFLDGKFNFIVPDSVQEVSPVLNRHLLPVMYVNGEGTQLAIAHSNNYIDYKEVVGTYYELSPDWHIKAFEDITVQIKGRILASTDVSDRYELFLQTSAGNRYPIPYTVTQPDPLRSLRYLNFDIEIDLLANENGFLEGEVTGGPATVTLEGGEFSVFYKNRFKTTYIKAIRAFTLLNELVKKMTDGLYEAKSDFLTQLQDYVLTCGDAIRGLEGAVIKTSLSDYYQSFLSRFMIGLGVENGKLMIEDLAYMFRPAISMDLGAVDIDENEFVEPAEDIFINTCKAGYESQDYEDVNGRYEFNQGQEYTTPIKRVVREMNLKSVYRADPFGIEFTRINFAGKNTTDADSDNDTFILNIETNQQYEETLQVFYYTLNRPAIVITGVPDPVNIFNVLLSPKRGLMNNGPLLRSLMDFHDEDFIVYRTCDKNVDLVADGIAEKDSVMIGHLGRKLFLPYYFNVIASVPVNFQEIINEKPYETITFSYKGVRYYGFLEDGGIQPAINDKQKLKLLATPANDVTKLIAA